LASRNSVARYIANRIERMTTEFKESEKLELKRSTLNPKQRVEFEPIKSGFLVIFHRDLVIAKTVTPQGDGGINGGINSLLTYVENNPGKKTADIGKGINVSTRTAERYIKKLRDDGKIEFRGSKKTGGYYKK